MPDEVYEPKLNKKEQESRDLVLDRFRTYLDYRKKNYDEKWNGYWNQYRSVLENESEYPFRARLFIPISFTAVETAIPRMVEAVFSSEPVVAVKPFEDTDVKNAMIMEELVNYQLKRMDFFNTFTQLTKDCFIIGSCFAKVGWREEYRKKKRIAKEVTVDPMTGQEVEIPMLDDNGKPVMEKVDVPFYDDPYIWYVDPYKFLLDPKANPLDPIGTSEAVILITESTIPKLKQMEELGIYKKISEVEKCKGTVPFERGEDRFADVDVTKPSQVTDKHSERVLLYEYWEDDRVIVVAEEKVVIRDEPNPYWHCRKPFVESKICTTNEIYGIGFMEMIKNIQAELNDRRNQRADNITLALNRMYVIARDADIDYDMLLSEPGGIIVSNYTEGVRELNQSDVTQSAFAECSNMMDDSDRTLGIHDPSRGKPTDRETATGIIALQEQANMRFKQMIMVFSNNLLKRSVEQIVDLNEQYASDEKVIRLTGGQLKKVNVEEIVGRYDYEPVGASLEGMSKYARAEQLIRARQVFGDNPDLKKSVIDSDIMDFMNFKDPNRYFLTDEEKQQMMMQQMGMMGMGGQQPVMGAGMPQGMPPMGTAGAQPPMGLPEMPPILPQGQALESAGRPPMQFEE